MPSNSARLRAMIGYFSFSRVEVEMGGFGVTILSVEFAFESFFLG